jgi:hypothetical protein
MKSCEEERKIISLQPQTELAQLAERWSPKPKVGGSTPSFRAEKK